MLCYSPSLLTTFPQALICHDCRMSHIFLLFAPNLEFPLALPVHPHVVYLCSQTSAQPRLLGSRSIAAAHDAATHVIFQM